MTLLSSLKDVVEVVARPLDEEALDRWSSIMLLILGSTREGRLSRRGSLRGRGFSGNVNTNVRRGLIFIVPRTMFLS